MNTDYILEVLKCCEALSGFEISADFLDKKDRAASISVSDVVTEERSYCDGSGVFGKEAELDLRLFADKQTNAENKRLIEKLCNELSSLGKTMPFPASSDEIAPMRVEVLKGADIISDDIRSMRYKVKFKVYFLKEKRG